MKTCNCPNCKRKNRSLTSRFLFSPEIIPLQETIKYDKDGNIVGLIQFYANAKGEMVVVSEIAEPTVQHVSYQDLVNTTNEWIRSVEDGLPDKGPERNWINPNYYAEGEKVS